MYCMNCGTQIPDGVKFCPECGASTKRPEMPVPVIPAPNQAPEKPTALVAVPNYPVPTQPSAGVMANVLSALRSLAASPVFLVGFVAYAASPVLTILLLMFSIGSGSRFLDLNVLSTFSGIVGMVPTGLMILGMWQTRKAVYAESFPLRTSGLMIIKVLTIISLVSACVATGLFALMMLIALGFSGEESVVIFFVVAVFAAVFALLIIDQVMLLKTLGSVITTFRTGVPVAKIPTFTIVMRYVTAVCVFLVAVVLSLVVTMIQEEVGYYADTSMATVSIAVLAMGASGTAQVCFGVLLMRYKRAMASIAKGAEF